MPVGVQEPLCGWRLIGACPWHRRHFRHACPRLSRESQHSGSSLSGSPQSATSGGAHMHLWCRPPYLEAQLTLWRTGDEDQGLPMGLTWTGLSLAEVDCAAYVCREAKCQIRRYKKRTWNHTSLLSETYTLDAYQHRRPRLDVHASSKSQSALNSMSLIYTESLRWGGEIASVGEESRRRFMQIRDLDQSGVHRHGKTFPTEMGK